MRESTRHRLVFNTYVGIGADRSLERLRDQIRGDPAAVGLKRCPSLRTLYRWSSELHWQDRIADMEREARVRDDEEHVQALREMNERHTREGLALQQKAIEHLQAIHPERLTSGEAIRALVEGVRLERLARGEVTDRTQIEGTTDLDLTGFSLAELRALADLAASRARRDRPTESGQPPRLDGGVSPDPTASDGADASTP